ncbi:Oidioi.mRNA.OKI2018_I69.XSR.g15862.t1.cds [Oikopleura dioica]|uniref:Oidioi.mRNA.OKI2018_I69.XSR.g15862.t1.cds n=1 Tax=Oikopleura dioica TaxID=34765 RepID=A0ABN7SE46_OIKDI|nr:Oidioi.mRNA.OKI2018_I69.XSR.g15862.t1.cds [Oikopleura dioica]
MKLEADFIHRLAKLELVSLHHQRKLRRQLVSESVKELVVFCEKNESRDGLVRDNGQNPFASNYSKTFVDLVNCCGK